MTVSPRILKLVPVADLKCAARHRVRLGERRADGHRFVRCDYAVGRSHPKCAQWLHLTPRGEGWVLVTDVTLAQVRAMEHRGLQPFEIAERVALEYRAALRRRLA
jgi:hypothetical protein